MQHYQYFFVFCNSCNCFFKIFNTILHVLFLGTVFSGFFDWRDLFLRGGALYKTKRKHLRYIYQFHIILFKKASTNITNLWLRFAKCKLYINIRPSITQKQHWEDILKLIIFYYFKKICFFTQKMCFFDLNFRCLEFIMS